MLFECLPIVDLSSTIMKIVVVWRFLLCESIFPCIHWNIWDRSRRISLHITRIEWVSIIYDLRYETRCALFLCFRISGTYCRISSHRDSFIHTFWKNSGNNGLFAWDTLFTLHNWCQDEFAVGIFSKLFIGGTNPFFKLSKKYPRDLQRSCIYSYTIGIWIEKSFQWIFSSKKCKFLCKCGEVHTRFCDEFSSSDKLLSCEIVINIIYIPSREDRDGLICMNRIAEAITKKYPQCNWFIDAIFSNLKVCDFWSKKLDPESISPCSDIKIKTLWNISNSITLTDSIDTARYIIISNRRDRKISDK